MNGDNRVTEDATARRQRLGRNLRKLRVDADITQEAVGERLGYGQAKVNKIETTLCSISMEKLEVLIDMYGVAPDEAADLRELVAQDLENGPPRMQGNPYTVLTDLELEASEIRCWHGSRIPGPLKSERYTLGQYGPGITGGKVTEVLRRRKARIRVLTMPGAPRYRAILDESSLYRLPGGYTPENMVDQVSYLLDLIAAHPQLELRILPFVAPAPYVDPDFQLLMFDDPGLTDFAYVEDSGAPRMRKKKSELKRFHEHWAALDAVALDVSATREFLAGLIL